MGKVSGNIRVGFGYIATIWIVLRCARKLRLLSTEQPLMRNDPPASIPPCLATKGSDVIFWKTPQSIDLLALAELIFNELVYL